jgi:molybdopterin synthase sulfur carrier subunit
MKVKVVFVAPFRELFGEGEREVGLNDGPRVKELLDLLCDSEERRDKLFDQSGELRAYVMILKNGQPISTLSGVQTVLEDGDEIAVFPPVTGG